MTRWMILIASALGLLAGAEARAALILEQRLQSAAGTWNFTFTLGKTALKIERVGPAGSMTLILNSQMNRGWRVSEQRMLNEEISFSDVPPAKQSLPTAARATYRKTGARETVGSWKCDVHEIFQIGTRLGTACVAPFDQLGATEEELKESLKLAERVRAPESEPLIELLRTALELRGVSVKTVLSRGSIEAVLVRAEKRGLAAWVFLPPMNFRNPARELSWGGAGTHEALRAMGLDRRYFARRSLTRPAHLEIIVDAQTNAVEVAAITLVAGEKRFRSEFCYRAYVYESSPWACSFHEKYVGDLSGAGELQVEQANGPPLLKEPVDLTKLAFIVN